MPFLSSRRILAAILSLICATALVVVSSPASAAVSRPARASVVLDWERILFRTVYPAPPAVPTPIPVGVLYLGFTSLAMYRAALEADRRHGSEAAAVAVAAHDVLVEYFPNAANQLNADLADSLADVGSGWWKQRGIAAGHRVAAALIARREHDGRNNTAIVYQRTPGPGVWQPAPGGGMLAPWIGFVEPLVLRQLARHGGPDPITSRRYAADYNEVKREGAATGSNRSAWQTDTALFFNANSATMVGTGLLGYLEQHPLSLQQTARLFASIHVSMTDSIISCWRLKYDFGFWRPSQAIQGAATDGNPATRPDPDWAALIPNPPYPDYLSGHGCLTSPAVQTIRHTLGENTGLTLFSSITQTTRTYPNLRSIESDAFNARIWSGLHFRDAMEDAYVIGHQVAARVARAIDRR